ncbi:MAG: prepilin-type N-terminal cleavage/methylation domain-containing protein [Betaproteobacteria bacterium]|nr:prepilin-type N-terminal cleavage/methylation domain-containing protein [Betaproteobacteria bacterium]
MKNRQFGFTLIEIAIVMVIIGLLIGGVLKGQSLIENAKIKSIINDLNGVTAAYYGYYDRKKVYPALDDDYIATSLGGFWGSTRTEGMLIGDPNSLIPGVNGLGGYLGVVNGSVTTGLSGDTVCTSVPAKFAQLVDTAIDDGISTSGTVKGLLTAAGAGLGTLNETMVNASPIVAAYGTAGYIVLCRQL